MDNKHNVEDTAVLPPLEAVYGEEAHSDIDLESMLAVAFDPATPDPGSELIPDDGDAPVDLGDLSDADDNLADDPAADSGDDAAVSGADDSVDSVDSSADELDLHGDEHLSPHADEAFGGSADIPELDSHFGDDSLHDAPSTNDNYDGF